MSTWADIQASWAEGWWTMWEEAKGLYDRIATEPEQYRARTELTLHRLDETQAALARMKPLLRYGAPAHRVRWVELNNRYAELAAGVMVDAVPAEDRAGAVPVLVVLGLVLGVAAIAWAVTAHEYVDELHGQTVLAEHELGERVKASREGRSLQQTTLPEGGGIAKTVRTIVGVTVVGGLVLLTGAVALPILFRRSTA